MNNNWFEQAYHPLLNFRDGSGTPVKPIARNSYAGMMKGKPSYLMALWVLFVLLGMLFGQKAFAAPQLQISMTSSVSSVAAGTVFSYTLQYKCASITENCVAATVTDILPVELSATATDVTMVGSAHTTAQVYTAATRTAKWTFVNPLPAGSTGQLTLTVKFPVGTTPDGATAVNTATMAATGAASATSPPVSVTATAASKWSVVKTRVSGGTGAALDSDVVYQLQVCSNSSTLNLKNAILTDVLPAGAVFVSASGGGTYANGNVVYSLGTISSTASCVTNNLTLRYPTGTFVVGASVTNSANVTGTVPGVSGDVAITPLTASLTHSLSAGVAARTFTKKISASTAVVGANLTYYFESTNTGNVALSNFSFEDAIPPQLNVTTINSGTISNSVAPTLAVEYQTSANASWTPVTGFPRVLTSSNSSVTVASLNLGAGVYITRLRYTYLSLPPGFKPTGTTAAPGFVAGLLASDRSGVTVNPGLVIPNTGSYTYTYNGTPASGSSVVNLTVTAPVVETLAVPKIDKAVIGTASVLPNDSVVYEITLNNASTAGATLVNPIVGDLLDAGLDYVASSWTVSTRPTGMPNPIFESIANYNGTGRTLLRWRFDGASAYALPVNTTAKIRFTAKVKPGTLTGAITNTAYLLGQANASVNTASCYTPLPVDSNDLDGDGNKTETLCPTKSGTGSITVNSSAALESVKWVKGQLDSGYSKYPSNGVTVAGGSLLYRLQVTNVGNVAMKNAQIIDILPFVGDGGVLDPQSRMSAWRPNLTAPVVAPAGVVVYYSTQSNLCRPELGYSPSGCVAPVWSITPPDDITRVQALKFDFGNIVLNPLDKLELNWPMRAPIGAPTNNEIAWNSFGYIATRADNGVALLASEPIKVGIAVQAPQPPAYGNFVWLDSNGNGLQDPAESGLNGVRVDLYRTDGTVVDSTLTTNDAAGKPGYYQFTNLVPGSFYALFYPPAGYAVVPRNAGNDRSLDSDVDPSSNSTAPVTLTWGQLDYAWDMGLKVSPTASIGNYVWYDRNGNGIQDEATNDGLNGVTVKAYATTNTNSPVATIVTADDLNGNPGYYRFDLLPGTYFLEFSKPTGASFTTRNATGSTAQTASKADPANGRTASFSVTAGQYDISWDVGVVLPTGTATLGDRVWFDANNNGIYEPFGGEQGIDAVRVNLYRDTDGNGVYTAGVDQFYTTTSTYTAGGNPGFYSFSQLPAGRFIAQIDPVNFVPGKPLARLLAGSTVVDPANGVDDDNNGYLLTGYGVVSKAVTLGTDALQSLDFGFTANYSLGNQVFMDDGAGGGTTNDGERNGGEAGIAGVVVKLYAADTKGTPTGPVLLSQSTDASGYYRFDGLFYGTYVVVLDKTNSPVLKNLVNSSGVASDFSVSTDSRDHGKDAVLGAGSVLPNGIASAPILLSAGSQPLGESLGQTEASLNGPDGDANSNLTADFGFTQGYGLGDKVWFDGNQDGIQQADERGIAGVTVNLYGKDGVSLVQTTVTDGSGFYHFDNVGVGSYVVGVVKPEGYNVSPQNKGTGSLQDSFDSDVDANGKTALLAFTADTLTVDAGLFLSNGAKPARIADFVWYDTNHDGVQNLGEPGLGGINVKLWDAAQKNLLASTVSDGRGFYEFAGLPAGTYVLEFVAKDGYSRSPQQAGGNTALDSDAAVATGLASVVLAQTQNVDGIDAGFYLTDSAAGESAGMIGDLVWYDSNQNGVRDSGEPGLPGVSVNLYDANDSSLLVKTKTNLSGAYTFAGLNAGRYTVEFVLPQGGYAFSPQAKDSLADPKTGLVSLELVKGQSRLEVDAGLAIPGTQPISLGDSVWLDGNGSLSFDAGEGLAKAQVVLYDSLGQELARIVTSAADANYVFTGLGQGNYRVAVDKSTLTANAAQVADPDTTLDSFHDVLGQKISLTNLDFGYSTHIDFGDLTDSYSSLLASNGARHVVTGVYLGSNVADVESDGQPTAKADGDNLNGSTPNDENGVGFANLWTIGQNASLKVTASAVGVLNAWADWNNNGTFEAGERIFTDKALVAGQNTLSVLVPATAKAASTGLRFRVTTSKAQGGDSPTGLARSGEVEDYLQTLYVAGKVGSIAGQVREDSKGDGNLAGAYGGLAGATVTLYTDPNADGNPADGVVVDSFTTTSDGQYLFGVTETGSYVVVETNPAGYTSTNDVLPPNDDRIPVTMASFATVTGRNFLDSKTPHPGSIAGQVRNDTQGTGNMAGTYAGLAGATLNVYTDPNGDGDPSDGLWYASVTTDLTGQYRFSNLPLGGYVVVETNPVAMPPFLSTNDAVAPALDDQIRVALSLTGLNASGADFLDSQRAQGSIAPVDLVRIDSKPLTDEMNTQCSGNINLFKDATAKELETYRQDNGSYLVFGVNVMEAKEGTENAQSQGVTVKDASLTLGFSNGKQKVYSIANGACFTETYSLVAELNDAVRKPQYTLIGSDENPREAAINTFQNNFDSTLKCRVADALDGTVKVTSASLSVQFMQTDVVKGDPEAYYDCSGAGEKLALLNAVDRKFVDQYQAGRQDAPMVALTNPDPIPDPMAVVAWNLFPSANSYYMVAYEDQYPKLGDYDFNDAVVAYQVKLGMNSDNKVVRIEGSAYLMAKGAAYTHDWHLRVSLPAAVKALVKCTTSLPTSPQTDMACSASNAVVTTGAADVLAFADTGKLFPNPLFTNYNRVYSNTLNWPIEAQTYQKGPKSTFSIALSQPVDPAGLSAAPFDPYLYVRDTKQTVQLLEVNAAIKDANGYPYAMMMPSGWNWPYERNDIRNSYSKFNGFVSTQGAQSVEWYTLPVKNANFSVPKSSVWAW